MSVSSEDNMRRQVIELAQSCLEGTASARQVTQLEQLLQTHQSARRHYLAFMQDSYSLRIWAMAEVEKSNAEPQADKSPSSQRAGARPGSSRAATQRKLVQGSLLVAALSAILLLMFRLLPPPGPADIPLAKQPVVAAIMDGRNPVWSDGTQFSDGSPLRQTQRLQLASGVARIQFDDGATVTLQGPANLELLSAGSARLQSGILTSYVPPKAVGFLVQTEALDVIDLGTSFGVAVTEEGITSVSVFSGHVEVRKPNSDETPGKIINQGESVVGNIKRRSIESVDFNADPFGEPLKAASGVVSTGGESRFLAEQSVGGMLPEDNEQILVGLEARDVLLRKDLVANFVPNPDGEGLAQGKVAPIEAGTRVDCFLVQFRPEPDAIPKRGATASARITFDRPILGLIASNPTLTQTDRLFAGGKTGIKQTLRGGESGENVNERERDTLVISNDRRTIEVTVTLRRHMDQARVLVQATDDVPDDD